MIRQDFADNAKAMGAWALKIEHLAWLYASIIEGVLIGGLGSVRTTAAGGGGGGGGDIDDSEDTLDYFHFAQRQQLYLQENKSSCSSIRKQV